MLLEVLHKVEVIIVVADSSYDIHRGDRNMCVLSCMRCGEQISKEPTDIGTLFYDAAGDIMCHYGLNTFHQEPVEESKSYPLLMDQNSDKKKDL